jgi:hypothetical protein
VLGFVACGALVRRSAFLAVGGVSPRLGIGSEEALLALDRTAAGWEPQYIEEIVAHYHRADTDGHDRTHADEIRNVIWSPWLRRSRRAALERTPRCRLSPCERGGPVERAAGLVDRGC